MNINIVHYECLRFFDSSVVFTANACKRIKAVWILLLFCPMRDLFNVGNFWRKNLLFRFVDVESPRIQCEFQKRFHSKSDSHLWIENKVVTIVTDGNFSFFLHFALDSSVIRFLFNPKYLICLQCFCSWSWCEPIRFKTHENRWTAGLRTFMEYNMKEFRKQWTKKTDFHVNPLRLFWYCASNEAN